MSMGVGGLGAIFFGLVGTRAVHAERFLNAAEWTSLLTVALLAGAFAIAFKLPRQAQQFTEGEAVVEDTSSRTAEGPVSGDEGTAEGTLVLVTL